MKKSKKYIQAQLTDPRENPKSPNQIAQAPIHPACHFACKGKKCPGAKDCEAIAKLHFIQFHSPFFF